MPRRKLVDNVERQVLVGKKMVKSSDCVDDQDGESDGTRPRDTSSGELDLRRGILVQELLELGESLSRSRKSTL